MKIYRATLNDINDLIRLRIDYLNTEAPLSDAQVTLISGQLTDYFSKHLPTDGLIAVIASVNNDIAAAAFLAIGERPANLTFTNGKTATLLNVLTYPQYRRRGIATQVIKTIIDEAKQIGVSAIDLYATEKGKVLYEKLGFCVPYYSAMRLKL